MTARAEAERKHEAQERAIRPKVSVDIPALSPSARQTLERIRDAIDRNDLPAGLEYALADRNVKAELEGFAKAVSERFGESQLAADLGKRCKRRDLSQNNGRDEPFAEKRSAVGLEQHAHQAATRRARAHHAGIEAG